MVRSLSSRISRSERDWIENEPGAKSRNKTTSPRWKLTAVNMGFGIITQSEFPTRVMVVMYRFSMLLQLVYISPRPSSKKVIHRFIHRLAFWKFDTRVYTARRERVSVDSQEAKQANDRRAVFRYRKERKKDMHTGITFPPARENCL